MGNNKFKIGIYKIICLENNFSYIGRSKKIEKRWEEHKRKLNNNKHENPHFQKAWNKYGKEFFEFLIYEEHEKYDLEYQIQREKEIIKEHMNSGKCFNMCLDSNPPIMTGHNHPFCGKLKGVEHPNYGKKLSEETKEKIRNKRTGYKLSEKGRREWSAARTGEQNNSAKLTWIIVGEIREKYKTGNYTGIQLAEEYGVSPGNIYHILKNRNWKVNN